MSSLARRTLVPRPCVPSRVILARYGLAPCPYLWKERYGFAGKSKIVLQHIPVLTSVRKDLDVNGAQSAVS